MGTIYQRVGGGTYYGYYTDQRGRSCRRSLRTRDAKVATARLRELELGATNPAAYSQHTLAAAIVHLLEVVSQQNAAATHDFYRAKCGHLVRLLGHDTLLDDVTRDAVTGYVRARKLETAGNGTIHKELTGLRRVLGEAKARKLWMGTVDDIVPSIKVTYQPREVWLDEHQAKQLLERIAPDRRLWVMLAIWGGLCRGEVERLEWVHVDLAHAVMRVPGTKRTSRNRAVPIAPMLLAALRAAAPRQSYGRVVAPWGNAIRALGRAAVLAKLPPELCKLTPNDLRRTFASLMLNAGVASIVVAKLMGHSSTKMVELVYGRISGQTYRSAVATLPVSDAATCAAGEQSVRPSQASRETYETGCAGSCSPEVAESLAYFVPRDGVEPPTRGFSVPGNIEQLQPLNRKVRSR